MAIAITEDFVTKSGLIVQGTGTVTSSTGQTQALQANSGAAIAKNLIVGTSAAIGSSLSVQTTASIGASLAVGTSLGVGTDVTIGRDLSVARGTRLVTVTATGIVSITNATAATTASVGALVVTGGIYSNNLVIGSTSANTGTSLNNALYVAGGIGVGKSLVVDGSALFKGDVVFVGSSTYVYSVNSLYTDNLLEIHVPPSNTGTWAIDDGKDIGLRFHYYSGSDKNAALVLSSDSRYLEWYETGTENGSGDFVSGTYGTFKTGAIKLVGTTTSTNTQTGDLTVVGGVGIGGDLNVGNTVTAPLFVGDLTGVTTTATNIKNGLSGEIVYQTAPGVTTFLAVSTDGYILKLDGGLPTWAPLSTAVVDYANTATNLKYGSDMTIPYQIGIGQTEFSDNLKYDYGDNRLRTVNATFTGTTGASSTDSGTLQVTGGVGIGENLWVGGNGTIFGDLEIGGGDITTDNSTFNLLNANATTVNFAGDATAITVGSNSGHTTIRTQVTVTNITTATSTLTGALTVAGGVGVGGNLYVGGTTTVYGNILPAISGISLGSADIPFADLFLGGNSLYIGNITISASGSGLSIVSSGDPVNLNAAFINATTSTDASSTNTGALQVVGGAGIGKNLWVGGNETILGDLEVRGGDIATNQTTFNLLNATATTVNFAGAATAINVGAGVGYIKLNNRTTITNTATSIGTDTGALVVTGGVGIGENLWVSGNETILGDLEVRGGDITTDQTTFNLLNANATTVNFAGDATEVTIGSTVGYTKIRNITTLTDNTAATSTTTGALRVIGGVGIGGALYVGTSSYINDSLILTRDNIGAFGVTKIIASTDTAISAATGEVTIWNTSTLQTITNRGNSTNNQIEFTNSTIASSTNTGAVTVVGGVGVGRTLWVGSTATISSTAISTSTTTGALQVFGGVGIGGDMYIKGTIYGVATTATNLRQGTVGQIPFQTNTGTTGFFGPGTNGQLLVSAGTSTSGHLFVNTSNFVIGYSTSTVGGLPGSLLYQSAANRTAFIDIGANDTFLRSDGSTATFVTTGSMMVGRTALADNVAGGQPGSILYQSNVNTTTSLLIGQSGYILQSDGTAPSWVEFPGGATVANATNVGITNDTSNTRPNYIAFINTTSGLSGVRVSGLTGITYVPSTGNMGIGVAEASAKLEVGGTVKISGVATISNATAASSTNTGGLQVIGGVGIGGNLWVGGGETILGDLEVRGGDITTNQTTFNLLNANATTVNFAGAGTTINIGSLSGDTNIKNNLVVVGNMTVQGTTTIVDSTVTNITDPILTLGGLANNQPLIANDNKDKGIAFKYFSGSAKVGFFGYSQGTGYLTFIPDATITNEVVTGTRGSIDVDLAGGQQYSLVYQTAANQTGFLAPGTAGFILQTNSSNSAPSWVSTSSLNAGNATTATNLFGGTAGQMPFQTAAGRTGFTLAGSTGSILISAGTSTLGPVFTTTSSIRVGYSNSSTNISSGTTAQLLYQTTSGVTAFAGPGVSGQLLVSQGTTSTGPIFVNSSSIQVGYARDILGGGPGQILYQTNLDSTGYVSTGTNGNILVSGGTGTPVFQNTSSFLIGYSVTATNIAGGVTGSLVYQSAAGTTALLVPGTSGNILQTNGSGQAPTWVAAAGLTAANATTSTNIAFGTAGQIPYQTAPGVTSFINTGSVGNVLVSNGTNAPTYNNTLTLSSTLTSISSTTGALVVAGGVGIGKDLHVGGDTDISRNIDVAGTGTFGGNLLVNGNNIGTTNSSTFNLINTTATTINFAGSGTAITIGSSTGYTNIRNLTTLTNATNATSTSSGALRVVGGVGIGGNLYVGGTLFASVSGTITSATNLSAGSSGTVVYQSAVGVTGYVAAGSAGQLLVSAGNVSTGPVFTNTSSIQVGYATNVSNGSIGQLVFQSGLSATAFVGTGTAGQLLVSAGATSTGPVFTNTSSIQVGYATNVMGGSTGTLVYQSNTSTTALLDVGTAGYVLQTNGTGQAPSWVTPSGLAAGSSLQVQTVSTVTLAVFYPTFVNANNASSSAMRVYTSSTFSINPGTREISVTGTGRFTSPANGQTGAVVLRQDAANTSGAYLQWTTNNSTTQTGYIQVTTTGTMIFGTTSTDRMAIDSNGNVGIGTNSPSQSLDVTTPTASIRISPSTTSNNALVRFVNAGGKAYVGLDDNSPGLTSVYALNLYHEGAYPIVFSTNAIERLRITSAGGISFGASGTAYGVSGQILVSAGNAAPVWTSVSGLSAGTATTATNLANGTAGQIPYQTGPGVTSFINTGTVGNVLVSNGTSAPTYNNTLTLAGTTNSTSTTTGALQVKGGVGIGGSVYVGNRVGFVNTSNISVVYQYYNTTTNSLDTVFG